VQHADWLMAALMFAMAAAILGCLWRARRGHVPYVRRIAGIAAYRGKYGRLSPGRRDHDARIVTVLPKVAVHRLDGFTLVLSQLHIQRPQGWFPRSSRPVASRWRAPAKCGLANEGNDKYSEVLRPGC
jgi:hypothetical protein